MAYWYRGRRYPSKPPLKARVKSTLKHLASRAWESIQGDHPAGGEALVERMIREFPGRPTEPTQPTQPTQPDNSSEKD
jgi:hypothetical protein